MKDKKLHWLWLACMTIFLPGCGGLYLVDPMFNSTNLPMPAPQIASDFYGKDKQINVNGKAFSDLFEQAHKDKAQRDALLIRMRLSSDAICNGHLGDIRANATNINLGFGVLASLFSGLAALNTGSAASSLAAAGAFSSGNQTRVSEEVYRNQLSDALIRTIQAERAQKRAKLEAGMDKPLENYTIEQGILDVEDYHNACSFITGLTILTAKAGDTRPATAEAIKQRIELIRATSSTGSEKEKAAAESNIDSLYKQLSTIGN